MAVTAKLNLNAEELKQLAGILKVKSTEIEAKFAPYAEAAVQEYARMFLGQKVFTRGSDMREYRLFLLIRLAFNNSLPDEQTVCDLFQCTLSQSRALIRAVMSKYQYELRDAIDGTLSATLTTAEANDEVDGMTVTVNSENIIAEFNKVLASVDGSLPPIVKMAGTVSTYQMKKSSYQSLRTRFGSGKRNA
jgi:hypothetical protein